ncbi:MAG: PadR family transcriptional regulator [Oscillatoria sp. PMC 1068.18]|nr:PadR family transcriptional regulator [Oscillatoria sp. PMC 1076.18]MEC4991072.1 PadR family transcriptional regulator [Oscillatoria sp. PMC 1068.18]
MPKKIELSALEQDILTVLDFHELYGLQIIQAIEEVSGGKRKLGVGSLYPTLHRMEKKGFVKSKWGDDRLEERGGARRKYYQITGLGKRVLKETQQFRINLTSWQPTFESI